MSVADYLSPADALRLCPEARAVGWTAADLGRLLRMKLVRGKRTKHRSVVCLPDVSRLARQVAG